MGPDPLLLQVCSLLELKDNKICVYTIQLNNAQIFYCRILNNFKDHDSNYQDILNETLRQPKKIWNIMKTNIANYRKITLKARADN